MLPNGIHVHLQHPTVIPDPAGVLAVNGLAALGTIDLFDGGFIQNHFSEENFSRILITGTGDFIALAHGKSPS
jgi:hypothetical protein